MRAQLLDKSYELVERVEAEPRCGEDFCDDCGDCLACSGPEGCYLEEGGFHVWVVYADGVEEFRSRT